MTWFVCGLIALGMRHDEEMGFWQAGSVVLSGPFSLGIELRKLLK